MLGRRGSARLRLGRDLIVAPLAVVAVAGWWRSTFAGDPTVLGSVANLVVVRLARH